jgi:Protein of unknown function (DUF1769)/Protein of unknown function, DUF547
MGYASVTVLHSANLQEDREAIMAIFPDKFQVEKQASVASESLQWEDQCMLILIPCTHADGTYASLVMDEEDIRQAAERAVLFGVKVYSAPTMYGPATTKMTLPGGASIFLSTADSWKTEESRNATITTMLSHVVTNNEDRDEDHPTVSSKGKQTTKLSKLRRSSSMPVLPLSIDSRTPVNPLFPSLQVQVLGKNNEFEPYRLNSHQGLPIETDHFVGSLLLVMRPANPEQDPYWNEAVFSRKKRRVIMQLQGKLKHRPKGELYAGLEISDPMQLGLLASGLCSLLLKMSAKFNPQLHYSFGDDEERAHMCFPASTFFEELVVTREGETPPPMGKVFEEDPAAALQRKAYKTKIDWNTSDTYSMSFHSMYMDFPSWSIVRLPIGRDVGLQTFWGNSTASIVWYDMDMISKKHCTSESKYFAAVEMKYLGTDVKDALNESMVLGDESESASEDQFVEVDLDTGSICTNGDSKVLSTLNDELDEDIEDQEFFDTVQSQSLLPPSLDKGLTNTSAASSHAAVMHLIDSCCPCVIEMLGEDGNYSHVFVFFNRMTGTRPLFRTLDIGQALLGDRFLSEIDDAVFSHRLSPTEASRRRIGLRYAEALMGKASPSKMRQFQRLSSYYDNNFLRRGGIRKNDSHLLSSVLARAVSDRQWIEERVCVTEEEVLFYRLDRGRPHFRISLASIVKLEPLPEEECPLMQGYHFLSIETFGRATCLMFRSASEIHSWIAAIGDHRPVRHALATTNSFSNHLIDADEPSSEFLRTSAMWDCSKRKLLNARKFSFRTPAKTDPASTLALAENALRKAAALDPKGSDDFDLIEFLDCSSALKEADAHALNEDQRSAFFLNVYHIMIMHAFIVLGPPDSSLRWLTYFNTIAYQCADDIFSLSELEHNIIRAEMSFPSQFLSRFVLPKSHYIFALTKKDIRFNFALNCGSLSIPMATVPVYMPDKLNEQLDKTTRAFLTDAVSVKPKGPRDASVVLPRVCQWFADDFGEGSTADVVKAIQPFLGPDQKLCLQRLWNDRKQTYDLGIFNVKYSNYSFECRHLTLEQTYKEEESSLGMTVSIST